MKIPGAAKFSTRLIHYKQTVGQWDRKGTMCRSWHTRNSKHSGYVLLVCAFSTLHSCTGTRDTQWTSRSLLGDHA